MNVVRLILTFQRKFFELQLIAFNELVDWPIPIKKLQQFIFVLKGPINCFPTPGCIAASEVVFLRYFLLR